MPVWYNFKWFQVHSQTGCPRSYLAPQGQGLTFLLGAGLRLALQGTLRECKWKLLPQQAPCVSGFPRVFLPLFFFKPITPDLAFSPQHPPFAPTPLEPVSVNFSQSSPQFEGDLLSIHSHSTCLLSVTIYWALC